MAVVALVGRGVAREMRRGGGGRARAPATSFTNLHVPELLAGLSMGAAGSVGGSGVVLAVAAFDRRLRPVAEGGWRWRRIATGYIRRGRAPSKKIRL